MFDVGIQGFGGYIPKNRIKVAEIAAVWGKKASDIERSLGLKEKAVASSDEDAVTCAFEAAFRSLKVAKCEPTDIEICLVGSESHPYAVNPTSTIVADLLGCGNNYLAADLEFACKAATAGMIAVSGLIASGAVKTGLVIGSDTAQAKPHDILEYTAASSAAAFVLGKKDVNSIASLDSFTSFSSDTPDFWRRDGVPYPTHGGRFTGEPAYFAHVMGAAKQLLTKAKQKPQDFDYCVFHMPNGKFPREVAKRLGFSDSQLAPSLTVDTIGNPYSASSLLGLAKVFSIAKPGQKIFMVSYGSGAGSDGLIFHTLAGISKIQAKKQDMLNDSGEKKYLSYVEYLRVTRKI